MNLKKITFFIILFIAFIFNCTTYYRNGLKYFNEENYEDAIIEFQKNIDSTFSTNTIESFLYIGMCYENVYKLEKARSIYNTGKLEAFKRIASLEEKKSELNNQLILLSNPEEERKRYLKFIISKSLESKIEYFEYEADISEMKNDIKRIDKMIIHLIDLVNQFSVKLNALNFVDNNEITISNSSSKLYENFGIYSETNTVYLMMDIDTKLFIWENSGFFSPCNSDPYEGDEYLHFNYFYDYNKQSNWYGFGYKAVA